MSKNKITPVMGMEYEWWNPNKEKWIPQTITELLNDIDEGVKIMDGTEYVLSLDAWYSLQLKGELKILLTYEQSLALKVKSSWIEGAPGECGDYWCCVNGTQVICYCDGVRVYEMAEEGFDFIDRDSITHHQPIIKPQMP